MSTINTNPALEKMTVDDLKEITGRNVRRIWYNSDIQLWLRWLNLHADEKEKVIKAIREYYSKGHDYCGDKAAMLRVLKEADVELFSRYDSAVCENFISILTRAYKIKEVN